VETLPVLPSPALILRSFCFPFFTLLFLFYLFSVCSVYSVVALF